MCHTSRAATIATNLQHQAAVGATPTTTPISSSITPLLITMQTSCTQHVAKTAWRRRASVARCPAFGASRRPRVVAAQSNAAHTSSSTVQPPRSTNLGLLAASAAAAALVLVPGGPAWAGREKIGEFQASGFLFKDTVEVTALDDPEVPGVTIYLSDFKRSLVDKLSKDFFSEPSQASLSCSISSTAAISNPGSLGGLEGKEVFTEKKGLNIFKDKTLRVRRIYDSSRQSLVYVAYSTRLSNAADEKTMSSGRYRTSVCALQLPGQQTSSSGALASAPAVAAGVQ